MAYIVPPQDALAQCSEHLGASVGIGTCTTRTHGIKSVDIYIVVHHILAAIGTGMCNQGIGLLHVNTLVLIISDYQRLVFPCAIDGRFHILGQLVDHSAGFADALDNHTAYSDVHALVVTRTGAILHRAEEVIGRDRTAVVLAVGGLPCEQMGIVQGIGIGADQAVVITAASHQQEVAQTVAVITGATVIEHLAQPAVGHCILSAAGKLVVHLFLFENEDAEMVSLLMQFSHTAGLFKIGTRRDDDHVRRRLAMDILVRHLTQQFGMGIGARLVKGHKLAASACRRAKSQCPLIALGIELHRGKGCRDIPHAGRAATTAQAVSL